MAGFIFIGTLVELVLEEHTGSPTQYIPFVLSILGVLGVLLILWRPPLPGDDLLLSGSTWSARDWCERYD